jgi:hypothetical protein
MATSHFPQSGVVTDISDLCELLQMPELIVIKQPSAMAKRQNRNVSVSN